MAHDQKERLMITPRVTEILPPWRTVRPSVNTATATQRDLVVASLLAGGKSDVYPTRPASGPRA
jgi:hypothetical protein